MKQLVGEIQSPMLQTEWAFLSLGHPQKYESIWRNVTADVQTRHSWRWFFFRIICAFLNNVLEFRYILHTVLTSLHLQSKSQRIISASCPVCHRQLSLLTAEQTKIKPQNPFQKNWIYYTDCSKHGNLSMHCNMRWHDVFLFLVPYYKLLDL